MSPRQYPAAFLALGFIALSVAACGRAGPLQAPPQKGETAQQQQQRQADTDEDTGETTAIASPVPTPQKQPRRPITIPNEPFILDPIL